MEALQAEVRPFRVHAMIVNPRFFPHRASFRGVNGTLKRPLPTTKRATRSNMNFGSHRTASSPAIRPSSLKHFLNLRVRMSCPAALCAGADAIGTMKQKVALLQQQINAYRDLSGVHSAFDVT